MIIKVHINILLEIHIKAMPFHHHYAYNFHKRTHILNILIKITNAWILLVNNNEILEIYNEIWNEIKNLFKKEFHSEPVYDDKYIKAKINPYKANVYGNKTTIERELYTCFSVILLYSIVNVDQKYHLQIFLIFINNICLIIFI